MEMRTLARTPLVLEHNRVQRLYTGGKLLNCWPVSYTHLDVYKRQASDSPSPKMTYTR